MRTCGSSLKNIFNVYITVLLYCLVPDLSFKDFSGSFLYWWKHILAHVRRELVRRLGIGFLYIQLENNFYSQAFQIDLAVSLFRCFYILIFTRNENNLIYWVWLRFFFSCTKNTMCLFGFVLKVPPNPSKKDEEDQTNENTVFPLPVLKISSSPSDELSSVLKAWRLSGWSVCLCRTLLVGKHLGILYLLYRSGLLTRGNSNQWESSFTSWVIWRTLRYTNIFPHYPELFIFLFSPKQDFWLCLNAPLTIQISNTYLSSSVLKSVPSSLLLEVFRTSSVLSTPVFLLFSKKVLSFRSPEEPLGSHNSLLTLTSAITQYCSCAGWTFLFFPCSQLEEQKANKQQ